jgi:hypothetical protein
MRRKLLPLILGGMLSVAAVTPAAAQDTVCEIERGGAAGLVAAVVQANACDIQILNDSLNNLLQNADIRVLNNILNNNDVDVDLQIAEDGIFILNDSVVSVTLLGGTVIIFQPA